MNPLRSARGVTLPELMIVMAIAAVVTLGLVGFYLTSQATWTDASTQALAQRDATSLLETFSERVRESTSADVYDSPDALHQGVIFRDRNLTEQGRLWWDDADSLVHSSTGSVVADRGPVIASHVDRFQITATDSLVHLSALEVRSANRTTVRLASTVAFCNR
jgi:prepilin-type N-terminal cleavage/methylation domain-containing protein